MITIHASLNSLVTLTWVIQGDHLTPAWLTWPEKRYLPERRPWRVILRLLKAEKSVMRVNHTLWVGRLCFFLLVSFWSIRLRCFRFGYFQGTLWVWTWDEKKDRHLAGRTKPVFMFDKRSRSLKLFLALSQKRFIRKSPNMANFVFYSMNNIENMKKISLLQNGKWLRANFT